MNIKNKKLDIWVIIIFIVLLAILLSCNKKTQEITKPKEKYTIQLESIDNDGFVTLAPPIYFYK